MAGDDEDLARLGAEIEQAVAEADERLRRLTWTGPKADDLRHRVRRHRAQVAEVARRIRDSAAAAAAAAAAGRRPPSSGGPR